jgi:hypothetical protein
MCLAKHGVASVKEVIAQADKAMYPCTRQNNRGVVIALLLSNAARKLIATRPSIWRSLQET